MVKYAQPMQCVTTISVTVGMVTMVMDINLVPVSLQNLFENIKRSSSYDFFLFDIVVRYEIHYFY